MNVTLPTPVWLCSDCDPNVALFLLLPASPFAHFHCWLSGSHPVTEDCQCSEPCESPICTCEPVS